MSGSDRWGQINLFLNSFESSAEAFRWLGEHSTTELNAYLDTLRLTNDSQTTVRPQRRNSAPAEFRDVRPTLRPFIALPVGKVPVLIFDTETTGLTSPIICQLAYVIVNDSGIAKKRDQILRLPDGVTIHEKAMQIHGITNEQCQEEGVNAQKALNDFFSSIDTIIQLGGRIVGHNVAFDVRAVALTREAHGMPPSAIQNTFCLMRNSKKYSTLKNKAGGTKAFRNDELYKHLYNQEPDWARLHSAYDDVCVTALNYIEGLNRKWW